MENYNGIAISKNDKEFVVAFGISFFFAERVYLL